MAIQLQSLQEQIVKDRYEKEKEKCEKEQAQQQIEAMQRELAQQKQIQSKLEESMRDAGINIGGGEVVQQFVTPQAHPKKEGEAQITYLLAQYSERIRQLELGLSIMGETIVTKEVVNGLVTVAVKSVNANAKK
jgi:hypothetical protein